MEKIASERVDLENEQNSSQKGTVDGNTKVFDLCPDSYEEIECEAEMFESSLVMMSDYVNEALFYTEDLSAEIRSKEITIDDLREYSKKLDNIVLEINTCHADLGSLPECLDELVDVVEDVIDSSNGIVLKAEYANSKLMLPSEG